MHTEISSLCDWEVLYKWRFSWLGKSSNYIWGISDCYAWLPEGYLGTSGLTHLKAPSMFFFEVKDFDGQISIIGGKKCLFLWWNPDFSSLGDHFPGEPWGHHKYWLFLPNLCPNILPPIHGCPPIILIYRRWPIDNWFDDFHKRGIPNLVGL